MKKHIFYLLSAALCLLAGCTENLETDPFGLSKNAVDFTAEGGEKNITVNTRCDCTLSCGESWVTFSPQYVETGKNTVIVTAAPNPTFTARQAAVTIFNEELGVSDKIAVRQSGIIPRIDCDAKLDVTYSGGTFSIEVDSSIPWKASTAADWIALSPANGQAGKSTLSVEIQRSFSGKNRQSEIILTNAEHKVSRKITVTQTTAVPNDQTRIIYTTNNNKPLSLNRYDPFDANIQSHIYNNGEGMLIFDKPVTVINYEAFADCNNLTNIIIPNSVISIQDHVFIRCSSLISIIIPDGVTNIGEGVFRGCSSLTSINIPDSVTEIGNYAFLKCSSLTSITIPDSVTEIGSSAFSNCSCLTSITIPDGVTKIGGYAFSDCSSLTSINIPDSVTEIAASGAFQRCRSLTSITIPDGVTKIGYGTFDSCSSLTTVYCRPQNPPSLGGESFDETPSNLKIYVPRASVDKYKSASGWSRYSSQIVGYDF